ncbi:hypothetical protein SAMN05216257_101594 [Meinhardsimonia xiamenensis]|uniref:PepSY domain-containing protein n=1 Tax=Meinhardsimonia xiamenensis TaxID=990712 RepID=A0A1G8Z600_9RHOB|nr:hypothetical protein [Meinhardsimonia xiamenensis]PRX37569.1 hypothetical protein LV81_01349 [Meinhardsimonia xiamenensis]SDK10509.1 hypothetical protein SAMN05216257_101594 [Meinhardsimonia xiamenensis]
MSDLQSQGFEFIEIKNGPSTVKVEAVRGATKLEVVYDRATGRIVKQETAPAGDDAGRSGVFIRSRDDDFVDANDDVSRDEQHGDDRDGGRVDDHDDDDGGRGGRDDDRGLPLLRAGTVGARPRLAFRGAAQMVATWRQR